MRIAQDNFKGELPRITPRSLPEGYAAQALNCRLLSTDLEPWKNFALIEALCKSGTINTIYPMHDPLDAATIYWLHWTEAELMNGAPQVDVASSTLAGDQTARIYFTGTDVPRWTNKQMATVGSGCYPIDSRPLGVINPDNPPTLDSTGNAGGSTSVQFTDGFDDTSPWVLSSDFNSGGTIRHVEFNANGNPGTCMQVHAHESNDCAYGYRDTGAGGARTTQMRFDVYCDTPATTGVWNFMCGLYRDQAGQGPIIAMAFATGKLVIGAATEWKQLIGITQYGTDTGTQPPTGTWVRMTIDVTRAASGLCEITATLSSIDGSTVYVDVSATDVPSYGGFIGLGNNCAAGLGGEIIRFDNVVFNGLDIPDDTSDNLSTSYVYTFVSDNGDGTFSESGPSPASVTISRDSSTVTTVTTDTSTPSGLDYNVTLKRIYRAVTGATGTAFYLIAEIPLSQADYVDTISDAEAAQGTVLQTEGWALPPSTMRGILALPNDIYAGFHDNVLDLSAQGAPHAWPLAYRLATDKPIVAIGAIDTSVVVLTEGFPYMAAGNTPDAYSMTKIEFPQSCVSARSVCYMSGVGVIYVSPDGLVSVAGPGAVELLTVGIFTREEWQALEPSSMICTAHDNRVFVQYDNGTPGAFLLETTQNGFGKVSLAFHATAMRSDLLSDGLYMVLDANDPPHAESGTPNGTVVPDGRTIYQFDAAVGSPTADARLPYSYLSKLYLLRKPTTFRYMRFEADDYDDIHVTLIDTGVEWYTTAVLSTEEIPIPDVPDKRGAEQFQFRITGTSHVRSIQLVETADELT